MFKVLLYSLLVCTSTAFAAAHPNKLSLDDKIQIAKQRCTPRTKSETYFFMDMYKSSASMKEIDELYKITYEQKERLINRAGYIKEDDQFISTDGIKKVVMPDHFLKSVIAHIEKALRLNYVKYVFFPDMGHSHIQVPQQYFDDNYSGVNMGPAPEPLTQYLNTPGLKSLYHTAEMLRLTDDNHEILPDRHLQWRFHTRNILADAKGNIDILTNNRSFANTVNHVPAHHWSYGINLSANKNGCFPFEDKNGQIQYFDISAWMPPYDCVNNFCG